MDRLTSIFLFLVTISIGLIAASSAAAQEQRYSGWQSPDSRIDTMIGELESVIDEGERSMAAHPLFLSDLRKIIDKYSKPQRTVFFTDDFSDMDYVQNPAWTVTAGNFTIDYKGALNSTFNAPPATATKEDKEESSTDRNLRAFLGVLEELTKDKQSGQTGQSATLADQAIIYSMVEIPNSFTLEYTFRSELSRGSVDIGVFQDTNPKSGYHLEYKAPASADNPMQLVKYTRGERQIIKSADASTPILDDGNEHTISLQRTDNKEMIVLVDNREVLRVNDFSYRQDFSGIAILNRGGSYRFDNIKIYKEL